MAAAINIPHINADLPLICPVLMATAINMPRINGSLLILMAMAIDMALC